MGTTLRPIEASGFRQWMERSAAEFAGDLIAIGRPPEHAHTIAMRDLEESFPNGEPEGGHAVFDVLDDSGSPVGYLWIGPDSSDDPGAWWVWDITIDADNRGSGFGRDAMVLGEQYARSHGARTIGLSVFAFNTAARGLYESLGYDTTSLKMLKKLGDDHA